MRSMQGCLLRLLVIFTSLGVVVALLGAVYLNELHDLDPQGFDQGVVWLKAALLGQGEVPFLGLPGEPSQVTFAGVYGALCSTKGTLGLLGTEQGYPVGSSNRAPACTADGAMEITSRWGKWVSAHNGGKPVVNVLMPTVKESSSALIDAVIAETRKRNTQGEYWYVILDLQGEYEFGPALERWVTTANPHVGFVLDVEWFGYAIRVSSINQLAERYFAYRESLGLKGLGILGVWYFNPRTVVADEAVTREWERDVEFQSDYAGGIVVPIMDGIGSASAKLAKYDSMMRLFGAHYGGMMGFTARWGKKYDSARPEDIYRPDILFWTQQ